MNVTLEWRSGRRDHLSVGRDATILDAADDADIALPFGCRMGACASCTGRLLDGEVSHRRPPRALKDRHLQAGYVLLCIAEPRAACRIEVGPSIQTELVTNPWK